MLRFPNPGSTIENFVAVYVAAFERFRGSIVNLDDLVEAAVEANLATSSGHMGREAIIRSTREDRSRDPLYNQMKMYAELFRSLGWLHPTETSALNYTFTLLGEQVVEARGCWRPLLGETVLGIVYPTHVLRKLRGNYDIRPFATILRTMLSCNHVLSRDEMIIGPLSAKSDRTPSDRAEIACKITALRDDPAAIRGALDDLKNACGVQINTLRNYTRWPLAILRDLDWARKDRERYKRVDKIFEVHRLTALGEELAERLEKAVDMRTDEVDRLSFNHKKILARHAHFAMMEQAGFDISSVADQLQKEKKTFRRMGIPTNKEILFSPFQTLSIKDANAIFSAPEATRANRSVEGRGNRGAIGRGGRSHLFVRSRLVEGRTEAKGAELDALKAKLRNFKRKHGSVNAAVQAFVGSRRKDRQAQFYPLVTNLLRLIGFESDCSRPGVNYQRWDACVWLCGAAIPIEIKSPAEELRLSNKSIRQAIENKVILLARGGLRTRAEFTTLIIGYQIPRERADMSNLIEDVQATFGFKIGVIDLRTLVCLAMRAVTESVTLDAAQFSNLKGFLRA